MDCNNFQNIEKGNSNYTRYVGYSESSPSLAIFFSNKTINLISNKVSELLQGIDPKNRKIIVPNHIIKSVMDQIYIAYRPQTADIYSRFTIPTSFDSNNNLQELIDQTIEVIVSDVKANLTMEYNNSKLTVWDTILGDHNAQGIKSHSQIKIRNRHPDYMQFFENY